MSTDAYFTVIDPTAPSYASEITLFSNTDYFGDYATYVRYCLNKVFIGNLTPLHRLGKWVQIRQWRNHGKWFYNRRLHDLGTFLRTTTHLFSWRIGKHIEIEVYNHFDNFITQDRINQFYAMVTTIPNPDPELDPWQIDWEWDEFYDRCSLERVNKLRDELTKHIGKRLYLEVN